MAKICRRIVAQFVSQQRMCSVFKSRINPVSGEAEWVFEEEDYDFIQETARSGYADMLHDTERNVMYHKAIANVVKEQKKLSKDGTVHVVDIGTGTGLLSMMAARAGATKLTAIEAFKPVAETARKIIDKNSLSDVITVHHIRSTDANKNLMYEKGDICVAEVFDTELIGEGALRTFKDAHSTLLKKNAHVVPASAKVFIQPIQSERVIRWEKPQNIELPEFGVNIVPPVSCRNCFGAASVHDVQLDELPRESFIPAGPPVEIFRFDFENPDSLKFNEEATVSVKIAENCEKALNRIDAVLFWWDLDMDGSGNLILSTEPNWSKKTPSQWRDHWMQAIYYLPKPLTVEPGQTVHIRGAHDEYSFWFDGEERRNGTKLQRPVCECGLHAICSRTNLGRLNCPENYAQHAQAMYAPVRGSSVVCVSDCSLLPLMAAQIGAERVISMEKSVMAKRVITGYVGCNKLSDVVQVVERIEDIPADFKPEIVIGDPFFFSSLLPWHNLHFWYIAQDLKKRYNAEIKILPERATLWGMPIKLQHLWKIRAPVGTVEGFDLSPFDDIVQDAITTTDAIVEPQPLWEYPSEATGESVSLSAWNLNENLPSSPTVSRAVFNMSRSGTNAIAFWVEWGLRKDKALSTGLQKPCKVGDKPEWDWYSRQGVYFLPEKLRNSESITKLSCNVTFDTTSGELKFDFT